jgi:hypothetical protein
VDKQADHERDVLFSAVKFAAFVLRRTSLLITKSHVRSVFSLLNAVKLFLEEFPGTVLLISAT